MLAAWRLTLALLGILFSQGSLGLLSAGLNRFGALTMLLLYLASWRPWRFPRLPARAWILFLALASAAIVLGRTMGAAGVAGLALLFLAWEILLRAGGRPDHLHGELVVAVTFYLGYHLVHLTSPALWMSEERAAHVLSALAGRLAREPYVHGATTIAWPALVFYLLVTLIRTVGSPRRRGRRAIVFVLFFLVTNVIYQALLTPVAILIQRHGPQWEGFLFNSQMLFVCLAFVPSMLLLRKDQDASPRPLRGRSRVPWPEAVALAGGFILAFVLVWSSHPAPRPGRILFYDRGSINFATPQFGRYGDKSGGMFGLLPGYLQGLGYETGKIPEVSDEALAGASCLITINEGQYFGAGEKEALWRFVRRGGSLLVLGDHTGVMGIRGPYNDLLRPAGIEFVFDSSTFLGRSWEGALELRPHPITRGLRYQDEPQIWVGASLGLSGPARPIIVARYGYSDIGDHANIERAFLGDRRYNPGEALGDIVLVADAVVGRGKVLVFGDTSSFQNLALVGSHAFVVRVFRWLTGKAAGPPRWLRASVAGVLLGAGVVWLAMAGQALLPVALAAVGLALGWGAAGHDGTPPLAGLQLRTAVVDASHTPRFDRLTWYDGSIGGLVLNLMRNGYFPLLRDRFEPSLYEKSELLLFLAPASPFTKAEISTLQEYARRGGHILLTVGYEEREGSRDLLAAFGAHVGNVPLATGHVRIWSYDVQLHEAWPVVPGEGSGARVIAEFLNHPVMVYLPMGEGGLVAVGDTYFLQNRNLEGREAWQEGNIMFLRELLTRMREKGL